MQRAHVSEAWSPTQSTKIGERHRLRDERFLRDFESYFRAGPILELGAATGHLAAILRRRGHDVTASDVSKPCVKAILDRGVKGRMVDATKDIRAQCGQTYTTVLAQNVRPLIRRDLTTFRRSLENIHAVLDPGGHLICISAYARRSPEAYFSPREQVEIVSASKLFRIVRVFPHQVVPTRFYRAWNAQIFNFFDHALAHLASVRLVWIAKKIDAGLFGHSCSGHATTECSAGSP